VDDPEEILVPAIVLYEVGRYVERTSGRKVLEEVMVSLRQCRLVPIDERIARLAIDQATTHRLHTADALIAAVAAAWEAEILTLDEHLLALPGARRP
jgi:predicted nucleic acid-binding protein